MFQSPPDSHCARRSQSESGAAAAVDAISAATAPKAMVVAANFVPTELVLAELLHISVFLSYPQDCGTDRIDDVQSFKSLLHLFVTAAPNAGSDSNAGVPAAAVFKAPAEHCNGL